MDCRLWALLSALTARSTALLAKKGVEEVPTNLALAVRVFFILLISVGLAVGTRQAGVASLSRWAWTLSASDARAENSYDAPNKVVPKEEPISATGPKFTRTFPANSVTILRWKLPARPTSRVDDDLHAALLQSFSVFQSRCSPPS